MSDVEQKYLAMTDLPRHLEERLLKFNILQLCALVSEKSGGPRWVGASDRYGPIHEIARRWKPEELAIRINDIPIEQDMITYARIMTSVGGNPSLKNEEPREKRHDPSVRRTDTSRRTMVQPGDVVGPGLAGCLTLDDLKRVTKEQGLDEGVDWARVDALKNFGLKRMWIGNRWRTKIRQTTKQEK